MVLNAIVAAAVESELLTVERVMSPPTGDPGWGSDLVCRDDLTDDMRERDGNDPAGVLEDLYRGLHTHPGELPADPDWGVDLVRELSAGHTDWREIRQRVLQQVTRDDRLTDVSVDGSWDPGSETLRLEISGELVDSGEEFNLTMVADESGSKLVEAIANGRSVA